MNININNSALQKAFAIILGILSANNLITVFTIGNTSILGIYLYCAIVFVLISFWDSSALYGALKMITKDLWLFALFVVLSIFQVLLFSKSYIHQWRVGVILFLLNCLVLVTVLMMRSYGTYIIKGVAVGILINAIISLIALALYKRGVYIQTIMIQVFPDAINIWLPRLGSEFRAMGLFKEPGHLMRYVGILALPVLAKLKDEREGFFYRTTLVCTLFLLAYTLSSSVFVFAVFLFLYVVHKRGNIRYVKRRTIFVAFAVIALPIALMTIFPDLWNSIITGLIIGVTDIFNFDGSNSYRMLSIYNILSIIKDYPFLGVGWNLSASYMAAYGFINDRIKDSYSFVLKIVAEMGIFVIPFLYFVFSKAKTLVNRDNSQYQRALGWSLLMYFALASITDYKFDGSVSILIGLVLIEVCGNKYYRRADTNKQ